LQHRRGKQDIERLNNCLDKDASGFSGQNRDLIREIHGFKSVLPPALPPTAFKMQFIEVILIIKRKAVKRN